MVAVLLAITGGFLLTTYVQGADARALAGTQPASVLVVTAPIAKGTTAEQAARFLDVKQLPAVAVVTGSVDSLEDIVGRVAAADLVVGEQVLASRFVDPSSDQLSDLVTVPPGMEEVSIQLPPQRVIGSRLRAGDTVGVVASFEFKDPESDKPAVKTTHLMLNTVLVTRVAGAVPAAANQQVATDAPSGDVMITLAVSAFDAERVVFAVEWGKIWLTLQRETSDDSTSEIVTGGNIFK
ncbi:MAG: Flp pilus assembly protein CpaB [Micropruina sp.]|nr:Flp pilus assembly protein CpaB [Micropruina sp.]